MCLSAEAWEEYLLLHFLNLQRNFYSYSLVTCLFNSLVLANCLLHSKHFLVIHHLQCLRQNSLSLTTFTLGFYFCHFLFFSLDPLGSHGVRVGGLDMSDLTLDQVTQRLGSTTLGTSCSFSSSSMGMGVVFVGMGTVSLNVDFLRYTRTISADKMSQSSTVDQYPVFVMTMTLKFIMQAKRYT